MELWDLYTEDGQLAGADHIRGEELPENLYHLVVHIWIRNAKGQYLISQRSATRPTFPLMWECAGGAVLKGENGLQGAIREAKEEVGVDLLPEQGKLAFSQVRKVIDGKNLMTLWKHGYLNMMGKFLFPMQPRMRLRRLYG